jgi:small subunit ribosomal protein S5e
MALGARNAAMKNHKTIAECLADEIMNCEKESPNSYAIKKKTKSKRSPKETDDKLSD